jgi:hypothetical protein
MHAAVRPGQALEDFTPVAYNYSFFHLIFALASMYIAMLMTGWGSSTQVRVLIGARVLRCSVNLYHILYIAMLLCTS